MHVPLRQPVTDTALAPLVMGVLNVTPDSFSDSGAFLDTGRALRHAQEMIGAGAAIIDVGAESTRPGSQPVPPEVQIARLTPVIDGLRGRHPETTISIDTRSAEVARAALAAGADWINDVSALRDDPSMASVAAEAKAAIVLMHMRGTPQDMQSGGGPAYANVVSEIAAFLGERRDAALRAGIAAERILFDPGIGFGKRVVHNLLILKHLKRLVDLGHPVVVGASRKSFIGQVLRKDSPMDRLFGSLACAEMAAMSGAAVIRAHDVGETVEVLRMCQAIRDADGIP